MQTTEQANTANRPPYSRITIGRKGDPGTLTYSIPNDARRITGETLMGFVRRVGTVVPATR
ncbi:hypothetical protein SAMN02949497_1724 [Methylomagnum ishizawai]|uniref:Uncharacterized protein n=1 Tax=Methylomagnum ishizawai TaxID=1760988 RepID=A0A1Y6CUS9_9GAMM|nr:hypothetical protein [Methylomagnum ishizawai]SMF94409.1 hypothetical protein SAMN02949497_1724 [Methylomagnum ishizawai]